MWMALGGPAASITAAFMVSGRCEFVVICLCLLLVHTADLSASLRPGISVNRNSSSSIKGSFFPQGAGRVNARNPQGGQNGREDGNRCEDDHDGDDGRCVIDADSIEHAVHGAQRTCT